MSVAFLIQTCIPSAEAQTVLNLVVHPIYTEQLARGFYS